MRRNFTPVWKWKAKGFDSGSSLLLTPNTHVAAAAPTKKSNTPLLLILTKAIFSVGASNTHGLIHVRLLKYKNKSSFPLQSWDMSV